jgi:hypothetical protein
MDIRVVDVAFRNDLANTMFGADVMCLLTTSAASLTDSVNNQIDRVCE